MEHIKIGDMYGILLLIKGEYENTDKKESFYSFSKKRINELFEKGFERIIEDERESQNKINQEI